MNILGKEYDATTVEGLKEFLCEICNKKVAESCALGFTFDGNQFSLSDYAQSDWLKLKVFQANLTFPKPIATLDNSTYLLTSANFNAFILTACGSVEPILLNCRNKKAEILACTTMEQLQAIQNDL